MLFLEYKIMSLYKLNDAQEESEIDRELGISL